jgi:cell division protein FtsL
MAAAAPAVRPRRTPAPQAKRRPTKAKANARQRTAQRQLAGGVVWIVVVAVLLAGVVALNVAVLRLNLRLDELGQQRAKLRAENATLASKLASAAASARIEQLAAKRLGVAPADPARTSYLDLSR